MVKSLQQKNMKLKDKVSSLETIIRNSLPDLDINSVMSTLRKKREASQSSNRKSSTKSVLKTPERDSRDDNFGKFMNQESTKINDFNRARSKTDFKKKVVSSRSINSNTNSSDRKNDKCNTSRTRRESETNKSRYHNQTMTSMKSNNNGGHEESFDHSTGDNNLMLSGISMN